MKNIIQLPVKFADAPRNAMRFTGFNFSDNGRG